MAMSLITEGNLDGGFLPIDPVPTSFRHIKIVGSVINGGSEELRIFLTNMDWIKTATKETGPEVPVTGASESYFPLKLDGSSGFPAAIEILLSNYLQDRVCGYATCEWSASGAGLQERVAFSCAGPIDSFALQGGGLGSWISIYGLH